MSFEMSEKILNLFERELLFIITMNRNKFRFVIISIENTVRIIRILQFMQSRFRKSQVF